MAIYVVRVATRTVNGDGCHEAMSLKGIHHTSSTDRRHYREVKRDISYYLMDYYNWWLPHQHSEGMLPAKAEDRPNQVSGFS